MSLEPEIRTRNDSNGLSSFVCFCMWQKGDNGVWERPNCLELFLDVGSCASEKHWSTACEDRVVNGVWGAITYNECFIGPLRSRGNVMVQSHTKRIFMTKR